MSFLTTEQQLANISSHLANIEYQTQNRAYYEYGVWEESYKNHLREKFRQKTENDNLQVEIGNLRAENNNLQVEIGNLRAENETLKREIPLQTLVLKQKGCFITPRIETEIETIKELQKQTAQHFKKLKNTINNNKIIDVLKSLVTSLEGISKPMTIDLNKEIEKRLDVMQTKLGEIGLNYSDTWWETTKKTMITLATEQGIEAVDARIESFFSNFQEVVHTTTKERESKEKIQIIEKQVYEKCIAEVEVEVEKQKKVLKDIQDALRSQLDTLQNEIHQLQFMQKLIETEEFPANSIESNLMEWFNFLRKIESSCEPCFWEWEDCEEDCDFYCEEDCDF